MSTGVPKKEPSYIHTRKNINITVHRATRRRKAYIQWGAAWFPKGIVTTLLSPPQCHAAFSTIPSTLAWVDQSPLSQHVTWQPPSGLTVHNCYRPHLTQGRSRVRIYDTPRYGRGVGFMGGYININITSYLTNGAVQKFSRFLPYSCTPYVPT